MIDRIKLKCSVCAFLVLLSVTGCVGFGPRTLARDRFAYTDALSESWKRQMLLNMVKLRYADAPIFLDVSSIINQYALETELSGNFGWNQFLEADSQLLGGRGRYSNRPTVTYQPLSGVKFARSLMTPIPPSSVLSMIQAGWRADSVFRVCIQSVNGIYNRTGAGIRAHPADPEFYRLMTLFRNIQKSRAVGVRIHQMDDNKQATALFFRKEDIDPEVVAQIGTVRQLLGLDPEGYEFNVAYGSLAQDNQEIAILTRSMLEILVELASYIDVPAQHVAEQRTTPTIVEELDAVAGTGPTVKIYSDTKKPADAFVAVQYRDHWFWIEDRDFMSKRVFSFLMFLFSLAETGAPEAAPVLTVPTG